MKMTFLEFYNKLFYFDVDNVGRCKSDVFGYSHDYINLPSARLANFIFLHKS